MELIGKLEHKNKLIRQLVQGLLLLVAATYYGSLAIMHVVSPIWDMLPLLLFAFTVPLTAALLIVHYIQRLNWLLVPLAVSLLMLAVPFLIVTNNFQNGNANQQSGLPIILQFLCLLQSGSIVFILVFLIGLIGVGIIGYFKYYSGK